MNEVRRIDFFEIINYGWFFLYYIEFLLFEDFFIYGVFLIFCFCGKVYFWWLIVFIYMVVVFWD